MKTAKWIVSMALAVAIRPAAAGTIEMDVNGLVCAFCAQGIAKTLRRFDATQDVYVSLEDRIVAIALPDGSDIGDDALTRAITDAGYTVTAIRRSDATLDEIRARVAAGRETE